MISSLRGPSGGPFMTHLLPGGGVPWVHGARSPVPPRLPLLAIPRSVHHLAAVAAGAYPLRRHPNAWSPGVPAPPGPCYWLVTSGTPLGWRGGCLAFRLVHGAVRHYWSCVRGARGRPGGVGAGAESRVFFVFPFPPRVSRAVCGGPSRPVVPYPRSLVRHSMRCMGSAGSVRLPIWYSPRVLCVCVWSRSRGVRAPPPRWVGVARAPRAIPVLGIGRAFPRGPCPSACPASVLCSFWLAGRRGAIRSHSPGPCVRGILAPGGLGGGAPVYRPPRGCSRGARGAGGRRTSVRPSAFPRQATKRVSSASLWSWRAWPPNYSGSCSRVVPGRGP